MRCLSIADGLNTITRRGEIGTSFPVLGLRPILWPFLRTTNDPKEESFTVSPRSRQSVISLSTSSTSVAEFRSRQSYLLVDRLAQIGACDRFLAHRLPRVRRSRYPSVFPNDISLARGGQQGVMRKISRCVSLPAQQDGAPGEAAAHGLQQHQIAAFDAPIRHGVGQARAESRRPRCCHGGRGS